MTTSRRARTGAAAREEILAAATALFLVREDGRVTVDAVCDQANVKKASFYLHFPSKDALGRAVSRLVTQPSMSIVETCLADGQSPLAVLHQLFLAQARQVEYTPKLARAVYTYGLQEVCQPSGDAGPPPFLAVLELIFRRGQEAGVIRPLPGSRELSAMAYCLFATTVLRWASEPNGTSLSERVRVCLLSCLDGWFRHDASTHPSGNPPQSVPVAGN